MGAGKDQNDMNHKDENYDEFVRKIGDAFAGLYEEAYAAYRPIAYDLCSRIASEQEVEHILDYMVSLCGNDRMLGLFKMICRKYYPLYPEMIAFEINEYRGMFEEE